LIIDDIEPVITDMIYKKANITQNSKQTKIESTNIITEKRGSNNDSVKLPESKKIKEEYKKNIKEKNYSKSIDTNIPKNKYSNNNVHVSSHNYSNNMITNITQGSTITSGMTANDVITNRIKINKKK
jgi:hypothetical protein